MTEKSLLKQYSTVEVQTSNDEAFRNATEEEKTIGFSKIQSPSTYIAADWE